VALGHASLLEQLNSVLTLGEEQPGGECVMAMLGK
jgi:hypothetical protein